LRVVYCAGPATGRNRIGRKRLDAWSWRRAAAEERIAEQFLHKLLIAAEVGWNPWSIHDLPPSV
jgi:hypothetical protein